MPTAILRSIFARPFAEKSTSNKSATFSIFLVALFLSPVVALQSAAQTSRWTSLEGPGGGDFVDAAALSNGTVVAATREFIYRSEDNGNTWSIVSERPLSDKETLAISTGASGAVYVGLDRGLIVSEDDGKTWTQRYPQGSDFGDQFRTLVETDSGSLVAMFDFGIGRSTDGGATWTSNAQVEGFPSTVVLIDGTIWASADGLFKSEDDGVTWQQMNDAVLSVNFIHMFTSGRILVGNGRDLSVSDDGGTTFTSTFELDGILSDSWNDLVELDDGVILAGSENGIGVLSSDEGDTWAELDFGLNPGAIRAYARAGNGTVIAATKSRGILVSTDIGGSWSVPEVAPVGSEINGIIELDNGSILVSTEDGIYRHDAGTWNQVYADTYGAFGLVQVDGALLAGHISGVLKSGDNGTTWTEVFDYDFTERPLTQFVKGSDGDVFGITTGGELRVSTDAGATWSVVHVPEDVKDILATESGEWLVGTRNGVLRSTDKGHAWARIDGFESEPLMWITSLVQANDMTLMAGTLRGDLISSTDNGHTWTLDKDVVDEAIDDVASLNDGKLWITTSKTVEVSLDGGTTFQTWMDGLIFPLGDNMLLPGASGNLYLATGTSGVYAIDATSVARESQGIPVSTSLMVNAYPNPFSSSSTVEVESDRSGRVTVSVYDVLGRSVESLYDGTMTAGLHTVTLDGTRLTPGTYFVRVSTREGMETATVIKTE